MMRAKTEQKVKRWKDQRWLIDSVIQAVGMEWDQPRLNYTMYPAGPDAIVYDPASKRVFAMNGRSSNSTAIDAATGKVVGTIALSGKPEFAVSDGAGHIYVNIEDKNEMWQISNERPLNSV